MMENRNRKFIIISHHYRPSEPNDLTHDSFLSDSIYVQFKQRMTLRFIIKDAATETNKNV